MGLFAKRKGVVISVISIKGGETKLEKLGAVADITKGEVDLVDPTNLNFSALISGEIYAVNVQLEFHLGGGFEFVFAPTEDVGNASPSSQITVEFRRKSDAEGQVPENMPFQVAITYTKKNGDKYLRVFTAHRPISRELSFVEKNLDIQTISAHLAKTSASMARAGNYEMALANAEAVKELINRQITTGDQKKLWDIFLREFEDIHQALSRAIQTERETGKSGSSSERSQLREDYTAKKLYNYSGSSKAGCLVQ